MTNANGTLITLDQVFNTFSILVNSSQILIYLNDSQLLFNSSTYDEVVNYFQPFLAATTNQFYVQMGMWAS